MATSGARQADPEFWQVRSSQWILALRAEEARIGRVQTESSGQCGRELDCEIDESEVSWFQLNKTAPIGSWTFFDCSTLRIDGGTKLL